MYRIEIFQDSRGHEPFTKWIQSLSPEIRNRIYLRLKRIQKGNFGDYKPIAPGVFELRLFFGGGLRIYFGRHQDVVIVLLIGGHKARQQNDIQKAIRYWEQFNEQRKR